MKHILLASAFCLMLAGCAGTVERELAARAKRYDAMLSQIKPGATRADLRQILPASARIRPFVATIISLPPGGPGDSEMYPLDADFSVIVSYQYQRTRWRHPPPTITKPRSLPASPSASDINDLLFGSDNVLQVYPQPTDRVSSVSPRVVHSAVYASCPWLVRPQGR